jgi:hypothetical protein
MLSLPPGRCVADELRAGRAQVAVCHHDLPDLVFVKHRVEPVASEQNHIVLLKVGFVIVGDDLLARASAIVIMFRLGWVRALPG